MANLAGKWLGRLGRFAANSLQVLVALAVVGAFLPAIPVFGSVGPLLISPFGSWIIILSLAASLFWAIRWRRAGARGAAVMGGLALLVAAGTGIIAARQIAAARANGVAIDLVRTLKGEPGGHGSGSPVFATYGNDGKDPLRLAIYQPAVRAGGAAPVLVYVHGGGWGGGTLLDRMADMHWFADRGYLVLSVEYTLSSEQVHAWNVTQPQIGCALAWINANAARLGGDPARLALLGESAGGNLVLNVSYLAAAGKLQPSCDGKLPHIAAVVAPYPVIDALRMYQNEDLIAGPFARIMTTSYTGGTPAKYPDRYAAISSGTHINAAAPPTLLFPALADHLLPADIALSFAAKARAAGTDVRVIAFPHGEHSFDQRAGSIGSQLFRQATLQFLARHGVGPQA